MIEFAVKKNGSPIICKPSEEGHGGSDMGLGTSMRAGIDAFWKKRGLSGNADYTYYALRNAQKKSDK